MWLLCHFSPASRSMHPIALKRCRRSINKLHPRRHWGHTVLDLFATTTAYFNGLFTYALMASKKGCFSFFLFFSKLMKSSVCGTNWKLNKTGSSVTVTVCRREYSKLFFGFFFSILYQWFISKHQDIRSDLFTRAAGIYFNWTNRMIAFFSSDDETSANAQ